MDTWLTSSYGFAVAATATTLFAAFIFITATGLQRSKAKLPPGPTLDPIIGALRSMPMDCQWEVFAEWSKNWGE